jgi:hypothetical protein
MTCSKGCNVHSTGVHSWWCPDNPSSLPRPKAFQVPVDGQTGVCHECAKPILNQHPKTRFCYACRDKHAKESKRNAYGR